MSRLCTVKLALAAMVAVVFLGCGPSEDERRVLETFNQLEEVIEKGGYVKELQKYESGGDKVASVEAEIVNAEGLVIGRLRTERVEGFGTAKPRIQWYKTPGVSEEWVVQERRRRGGPGRNRDGRPGGPQQQQQQQQLTEVD